MARLARRLSDGRWQVMIIGHLCAADLRRLERTCAPALEHYPTPLDLRVDHLTGVDEPARLFITRLLERGAVLIGKSDPWPRGPLPAARQAESSRDPPE